MYGVAPYASLPYAAAPLASAQAAGAQQNVLFLSSREIDRATLMAASEVTSLPVVNLQDQQPAKKYRTSSKLDQYIVATFAGAVACNAAAFVGGNFSAVGVYRARLAATLDDLTAAPSVDTGWQSVWSLGVKPADEDWPQHSSVLRWTNDAVLPYLRLDFADVGDTEAIDIGRLIAGRSCQLTYNVDVEGVRIGLQPPDEQRRTNFGHTYTDPRGDAPRLMVLQLSGLTSGDLYGWLFDLQRYCGLARDFVVSIDPALNTRSHFHTMQALFSAAAAFDSVPWWDNDAQLWRTTLTLSELI